MSRAETSRRKRGAWHAARVAAEDTPRRKLSAECQWLISEASKAGPEFVQAARLMVRAQIQAIQDETRGEQHVQASHTE